MLCRPLNEEDHQSPDDLLDISIFAPKSSTSIAPTEPGEEAAKTFDSTYSRQLRHVKLAVTEASYVLAVSELKIRQYAVSSAEKEQTIGEVGKILLEAATPLGDASQTIINAVGGFSRCLDTLGMNGEHPTDKNKNLEKYWEELEPSWYRTHMMRMLSYLQYIFTVADNSSFIPTSEAVLAYFELMKKHGFFMNIDDMVRTSSAKHTLVSTVLITAENARLGRTREEAPKSGAACVSCPSPIGHGPGIYG